MEKQIGLFDSVELSQHGKTTVAKIKEQAYLLLSELESLPSSREVSLAKTKLEEAVMWAVKGVSRSY